MLVLFLLRLLLHCSTLLRLGLLLHLVFVNKLLGLLGVYFGPMGVFSDLLCLLLPLYLLSFLPVILRFLPPGVVFQLVSFLVVIDFSIVSGLPLFSYVSHLIFLLFHFFHSLFLLLLLDFLDEFGFLLLSHTFLARSETPVCFEFRASIRFEQV